MNVAAGPIDGPLIQGRDFHGGIHFHLGPADVAVKAPREVPPRPEPFVNREVEIAAIDRFTAPRAGAAIVAGAPSVVVVRGSKGVGKTAVGRYWAHINSGRFRDGQLYVDFREHRHAGVAAIGTVLGDLLRSLGVRDEVIPAATSERVKRFRTETADKELLLLLDDVQLASEVTQLLPTSAASVVLVTSHRPLRELLRTGARPVDVLPLERDSAEQLLVDMIGDDRARDEDGAVRELVRLCAGLPIALSICGARLADTGRPVAWLVDLLSDEMARLSELEYDEDRSLQAVFDEASAALSEPAQILHRRLGVFPGSSVTEDVAAAAGGVAVRDAAELLDELATARLIEQIDRDRFRYHDLLRTHAHVSALRTDSPEVREEALSRIVDAYVAACQRMDRAIALDRLRLTEAPPAPAAGERVFATPADALAWFESERPNLLEVLRAAHDRELYDRVWQIGEALWLAYRGHGHWDEAEDVFALAADAAHRVGDIDAEARMRSQRARAQMELGNLEQAEREFEHCHELMGRSSNRALAASIVEWHGVLHLQRHEDRAAIAKFERALEMFAAAGVSRGVTMQRYLLGRALVRAGEPERAVRELRWAAERIDAQTDQFLYGRVLWRLGEALAACGRADEAREALADAVTILRRHSAYLHEAEAHEAMAALAREAGDVAMEVGQLEAALAIYVEFETARAEAVRRRLVQLRG